MKHIREEFARFCEEPSREGFRELLKFNDGETRVLDFKADWPEMPAVAKHLLGIFNSGGGCLAVGVDEKKDKTLDPVGIEALKDKADIANGLKNYLPEAVHAKVSISDFSFDASEYQKIIGRKYQLVFVERVMSAFPALAQRSGKDIKAGAIYVRFEGQTAEASHDQLQVMLNERIESAESSSALLEVSDHIKHLKALYDAMPRYSQTSPFEALGASYLMFNRKNNHYPTESLEAFLGKMIVQKKKVIASLLGADYKIVLGTNEIQALADRTGVARPS